eukprot:CAMPEP_0118856268 /NCGR_PEP_ID=MMETSP1163-20130328/3809_1 /TAXON_ID=124430 /ORGANISM="Phaeomonas parva, Strain CCMP2877" /LENGTH=105 /DNA_ID=CAMNT_0006789337 /DNA_START=282 /DNA_END=599 /DNA_ORIENTATION=+
MGKSVRKLKHAINAAGGQQVVRIRRGVEASRLVWAQPARLVWVVGVHRAAVRPQHRAPRVEARLRHAQPSRPQAARPHRPARAHAAERGVTRPHEVPALLPRHAT